MRTSGWRRLSAQDVVDDQVALIDVTTLRRDGHAIAGWNQRVREVHPDVGAVSVPIPQMMESIRESRHRRRCVNARGAFPVPHTVDGGKPTLDEFDPQRDAVDVERNGVQHAIRVGPSLGDGDHSVAVDVDFRQHHIRHCNPWRQIQLEFHAIRIDGETRGLQVLVPPVRGRPASRHQDEL